MLNNSVIRYCRLVTAVTALAVLLSLEYRGVWQTAVKYTAFFLLALLAGYKPTAPKAPPRLLTLHCVALILAFTVMISYILPADGNAEPFDALRIVSAVILAPVFEELFFRGAMVRGTRPFVACLISSLVFGLFHGEGWLQAFLLGLILSYFYISSGNIAVPIICHAANNLLAVVSTLRDIRIPVLVISVAIALVIYIGVKNEEKIL